MLSKGFLHVQMAKLFVEKDLTCVFRLFAPAPAPTTLQSGTTLGKVLDTMTTTGLQSSLSSRSLRNSLFGPLHGLPASAPLPSALRHFIPFAPAVQRFCKATVRKYWWRSASAAINRCSLQAQTHSVSPNGLPSARNGPQQLLQVADFPKPLLLLIFVPNSLGELLRHRGRSPIAACLPGLQSPLPHLLFLGT